MHTPTQAGGRRSAEVRGGSLCRWLLALGVIAGVLFTHVLDDHDVAPDHGVIGGTVVSGPIVSGAGDQFDPSVLAAPASVADVPVADVPAGDVAVAAAVRAAGWVDALPVPVPAGVDLLVGCVLALLGFAGAAVVMALTGRRPAAGAGPVTVVAGERPRVGGPRVWAALGVLRV